MSQDLINCRSCNHITAVDATTCRCTECGEMVCLHCGCTNEQACFEGLDESTGCYWVRKGLCSACEGK